MKPKNEDLWIQRAELKRYAQFLIGDLQRLVHDIESDYPGFTTKIAYDTDLTRISNHIGKMLVTFGAVEHAERTHFKKKP
ncbi:MAG TPA: hypothetical protein VIY48_16735 [Candidatus Paceibacterota bacterium]